MIPSLARLSLNALSQTYCFVNVLEEVGPTNFVLVKTRVSIGPNPRIGRRRYIPFYLLWFYLYTISKTMAWKKQGHLLTNIMGRDLTLPVIFYFNPCKDTLRHGLAVVCPSTNQSCHVTWRQTPISQIYGYLWRNKPQCRSVVEAVDPFKWAPTSMSNTYKYKVFSISIAVNVHINEFSLNYTTAFDGLAFESFPDIWYYSEGQTTA